MFIDFSLCKMEYKSRVLSYRVSIGNQSFDIDEEVFNSLYPNIDSSIIESKQLKLINDIVVLEDILNKDNSPITVDISNDIVFLYFLKDSLDMSSYLKGSDSSNSSVNDYSKYFVSDKTVGGSQLKLISDVSDTVMGGNQLNLIGDVVDTADASGIVNRRSFDTEEELEMALKQYGVLLDRAYKVGDIDNILDEPYLKEYSNSTKAKYTPLYKKHRRFFSNVVFLVDHVKTTTGGVKAKKIGYSLINDNRFKEATKCFLDDIKGDIDYSRIRVWYKIATGRDMLEFKGKLVNYNRVLK